MDRKSRIVASFLWILLVYYEVFRWVPLGRWNWQFRWPVENDQFVPDIVIGVLLTFFVLGFVRRWRPAMWIAVVLLGLWVGVHLFDWWLPYFEDSAGNYARFRFYAPHTQLLPVIGHHYPPDGGHAVLDFLLFPTWFVCLWASVARRNSQDDSSKARGAAMPSEP